MKNSGVLTFEGLSIRGFSRAGDETWLRVDPPGLALDVGRGAGPLVGARWIFLSHTHLDHCSGLPWVLTQRKFQGLGPTTVLCPMACAEAVGEYLQVAGRLEGESLEADVVGLEPGAEYALEKGLRLEVFAASHTAPALGCHLIRSKSRLRADLRGLAPGEVARLKDGGSDVTEMKDDLWLSYCGDTSAAVFDREPRLFDAKILVTECTFLGPETRSLSERFGHLHLDDFSDRAERFHNDAVVLCHLSRRHRPSELRSAVRRALPDLADRIHFLFDTERLPANDH